MVTVILYAKSKRKKMWGTKKGYLTHKKPYSAQKWVLLIPQGMNQLKIVPISIIWKSTIIISSVGQWSKYFSGMLNTPLKIQILKKSYRVFHWWMVYSTRFFCDFCFWWQAKNKRKRKSNSFHSGYF